MRNLINAATVILLCSLSFGCAVMTAAATPEKKNVEVINNGTSRAVIVAELGLPITTEIKDNRKMDTVRFYNGYSRSSNLSRVFLHSAADTFTCFLWEIVAYPIELSIQPDPQTWQFYYNEDEKLENAVCLIAPKERKKKDVAESKKENTIHKE